MPTKQPNGRWKGRAYVWDQVAQKATEKTKTFDLKRQAVEWETEQRRILRSGIDPNAGKIKLAAFIDQYGAEIEYGLGVSSLETLRVHTRRRIRPDLGYLALDQITPARIEQAQAKWAAKVSASTILNTRFCLSRILNLAVKQRRIEVNPVKAAGKPKPGPKPTTPTLDAREVEQLLAKCAAASDHFGAYVHVAVRTGLRAGELEALRVGDVDIPSRRITVARAFSGNTHLRAIQTPKSGLSRVVPISADLIPILVELMAGQASATSLFRMPSGAGVRHDNFLPRSSWKAVLQSLGHPGFRFHDLRATAIVTWLKAGVPVTTVREWAGHADLKTTSRYVRIALGDHVHALADLDSYLTRTAGEEVETAAS